MSPCHGRLGGASWGLALLLCRVSCDSTGGGCEDTPLQVQGEEGRRGQEHPKWTASDRTPPPTKMSLTWVSLVCFLRPRPAALPGCPKPRGCHSCVHSSHGRTPSCFSKGCSSSPGPWAASLQPPYPSPPPACSSSPLWGPGDTRDSSRPSPTSPGDG